MRIHELFIYRKPRSNSFCSVPVHVCHLEQLEQRTLFASTPLAADFSSARDNHSMQQILVDGRTNLLQGAGFHIIGSVGIADDDNNIASDSRNNSNGVMRPYNNNVAVGGEIGYSLKFKPDQQDKSKLGFSLSVKGSPSKNFDVMIFPLEADLKHFQYYRSSSAPTLKRYDQLPLAYNNANGNYYLEPGVGSSQWAEMVGSEYTLRVTMTATSGARQLYFTNAPGLGGGIRDLDFGFQGGLPAGQSRTAAGIIQVFRTDPKMLPSRSFESESNNFYQIGNKNGDGRSAMASEKGFIQYGPYLNVDQLGGIPNSSSNLTAGKHTATFTLMVDNNSANNNRILTIDVYDSVTGKSIKKMDLTRKMFKAAKSYQDFTLEFDAKPGQKLEFRTFSWGGSWVKLDKTTVR
jgi:hypothetical protein